MTLMPWVIVVVVVFLTFIVVAGRPRWDAYVKLAQLRRGEDILHEEQRVSVRTQAWAAWPMCDWTYAGGAPNESGWFRARVALTNERILFFIGKDPCSIVDFTRRETLPKSWLAWRQQYLIHVTRDDISVTTDHAGETCLEVMHEPEQGNGLCMRIYLRNFDVARTCFASTATSVAAESD